MPTAICVAYAPYFAEKIRKLPMQIISMENAIISRYQRIIDKSGSDRKYFLYRKRKMNKRKPSIGKKEEEQEFFTLTQKISWLMDMGTVGELRKRELDSDEQGFSGARLFRLNVLYKNGKQSSFICKKTDRKERMVMQTLTEQGHANTPVSCTLDSTSEESAWMIQQDLGKRVKAPQASSEWMKNVADALAGIHLTNMGCGTKIPWLPHADAKYWEKIITEISLHHFEKEICEDPEFAKQFETFLPRMQESAKTFFQEMTDLCQEKSILTITHGDLQNIDGDHVYNIEEKPYFIDFGFSRYAPFYIDLVDYFTLEQIPLCYHAYAARGLRISPHTFEEQLHIAYKYPGFIYLFPGIMQWKNGSPEKLNRIIRRILSL